MDKTKKHKFFVIVCCVAASFCLWLYIYNIVSPVKEYKLRNVPVTLINTSNVAKSKLVILPGQKLTVDLNLKVTASEFYNISYKQFKITADMSEYALKAGDNNIAVHIEKSPQNINIINSDTLYVTVTLDSLSQKNVPVKVEVSGKPKDGYYTSSPEVQEKNVSVIGPKTYVDMVSFAAAKCNISDMDKNLSMVIPVKAEDKFGKVIDEVSLQPKDIKITIPVSKIKTVSINVKTTGNPNNCTVKSITVSPDKVDISGYNKSIDEIEELDTEPVDLSGITDSTTVKAKIVVPDGVKIINSDGTVDVTISVDKVVQKSFNLTVKYKNLGSIYNASSDSSTVSLTVKGSESVINNLKDGDVDCFVDVNNLSLGSYSLPVAYTLPDGVTKVSSSPDSIKVIITKK